MELSIKKNEKILREIKSEIDQLQQKLPNLNNKQEFLKTEEISRLEENIRQIRKEVYEKDKQLRNEVWDKDKQLRSEVCEKDKLLRNEVIEKDKLLRNEV